jgi:hypothetical protein
VVDTTSPITATRTNLTARMAPFMRSGLPATGLFPTVAFAGAPAAPPSLTAPPSGPAGSVLSEVDGASDGFFAGDVRASRPAVVLLKASYDPRWQATVDGRPVPTEMLAPALVGVPVPPGDHRVVFAYRPFAWYPALFAIGGLSLLALGWADAALRRKAAAHSH